MFLFRNLFVTIAATSALVANLVPCAFAAPWYPMHFVMEEDPANPQTTTVSCFMDAPNAISTAIDSSIASAAVPTETSEATTEAMSFVAPTPIPVSESSLEPEPTATTNTAGTEEAAVQQTSSALPVNVLGGQSLLIGSAATILYFIL
ncbi:uncharacterized protein FIBRA_02306 [Fibroporia radiculosa]|uniref:Uncharacterized protein n=1 Tax=Fibroporia radiculosa TaxID=599839 RepID=J4I8Z6_9APHY|nr:uncharacterized protein FIBRA_02306 [Fibroporia radiculosa]CCM00276.1 predicted protein [Fibroporia radiculosa]